jgi:hypothetical protein
MRGGELGTVDFKQHSIKGTNLNDYGKEIPQFRCAAFGMTFKAANSVELDYECSYSPLLRRGAGGEDIEIALRLAVIR